MASRVAQTKNVDLHILEVFFECLVLCHHLNMLIVQLKLCHRVCGVYVVFLYSEIIDLLSRNIASSISFRLYFYFLSSILLLNVLIIHDIVQVSFNLSACGVLKY